MKTASPSLSVAAAVFFAAVFAVTSVAQSPQPSRPPMGGPQHEHHFPAPKNLQVLPKNLSGDQVHKIMEGWAHALGTHCSTCHAPNPNAAAGPGHRKRLDFALDIKPEKNTARLMYKMVQDINGNYMSKFKNSGVPVSCGTCHRGHLHPPIFKAGPEHHEGPRPQGGAPASGV